MSLAWKVVKVIENTSFAIGKLLPCWKHYNFAHKIQPLLQNSIVLIDGIRIEIDEKNFHVFPRGILMPIFAKAQNWSNFGGIAIREVKLCINLSFQKQNTKSKEQKLVISINDWASEGELFRRPNRHYDEERRKTQALE